MQGQVLAQYDSGTWGYVLPDALGSVRTEADASGQVAAARNFDPFGVPLGPDGGHPFGYTGEPWDSQAELLYLRARYYQPVTGRFLSKDPWKGDHLQPQSLNAWGYVESNPINRADPSGRCWGALSFLRHVPYYDKTCENLDAAIFIAGNPQASDYQRLQAVAYVEAVAIPHLVIAEALVMAGYAYLFPTVSAVGQAYDATQPCQEPLPGQQPLLPIPTSPAEMPLPIPTPPAGVPLPIPTPPALMPPPYPSDPTQSPGPGWEWRPSSAPPGSNQGSWYNPDTHQSLHPEIDSPDHGPHYDYNYRGSHSNGWWYYPDGTLEEKP